MIWNGSGYHYRSLRKTVAVLVISSCLLFWETKRSSSRWERLQMTSCFEKKLLEEWKADVSVISAVISPCLDLRQLFDFDLREKVLIRTNWWHSSAVHCMLKWGRESQLLYETRGSCLEWSHRRNCGCPQSSVDCLCCGMITQWYLIINILFDSQGKPE